MREGQLGAAFGNARQDVALLFRIAGQLDRGAAQHDGGQVRLQYQMPPEGLHQQHHVHGAAAEAAELLGEGQAEQAELGILPPERGAPTLRRLQEGLALFEGVLVAQQPIDAIGQQALVVGQIKVHYSPNTALFKMFFWISLVPP